MWTLARNTKQWTAQQANNLNKEDCLNTRTGKIFGAITITAVILLNGCGPGTMEDNDGNVYKTVKIGNQIWMAENLRTTTFNDGTPIPRVTGKIEWVNLETPGYCYYKNSTDVEFQKKWGALYNWYSVQTGGLAPKGWRVPTDDDWKVLQNYMVANGYNYDGSKEENKIAKSLASRTDWKIDTDAGTPGNNPESNNKSGFSALPGGYRDYHGSFDYQSDIGHWWSATEYAASYAYYRYLNYFYEDLCRYYVSKSCGFSLRLVRDSN
jgi:uncharacterized protein (TIGR02145 family)